MDRNVVSTFFSKHIINVEHVIKYIIAGDEQASGQLSLPHCFVVHVDINPSEPMHYAFAQDDKGRRNLKIIILRQLQGTT